MFSYRLQADPRHRRAFSSGLSLCSAAFALAGNSVSVDFDNRLDRALALTTCSITSTGASWQAAPPNLIPAKTTAHWKVASGGMVGGAGGMANYKIADNIPIIVLAFEHPLGSDGVYRGQAPAGFLLTETHGITNSGAFGSEVTVRFTLMLAPPPAPTPIVAPIEPALAHTRITSLALRAITTADVNAATADDVAFDVGPLCWILDRPNAVDFTRGSDVTFPLDLQGRELYLDDLPWARLVKKGVGGWVGAADGPAGSWQCGAIHLIVNGTDRGAVAVNQWLGQSHPLFTHLLQTLPTPDLFVKTLKAVPGPMDTRSEDTAATTSPAKMPIATWLGVDPGNVTVVGTLIYNPGRATDG
ncbi:MAG: hypothetical protein HY248_01240, partial [Fimbriimonas ginsengisoli]|nr:hypothetical protein [Fimbriimonas ginsengisoli]